MAQETRLKSIKFDDAIHRSWLTRSGDVTIFVGKNGAGKSRLLTAIARDSCTSGHVTIAVSNTPYSNFKKIGPQAKRLLAREGALMPEKVLKAAIANAEARDQIATRQISRVLQHCGYGRDLGIKVTTSPNKVRGKSSIDLISTLPKADSDEILSLSELLLKGDVANKTIWFDFDSERPSFSYRSLLPRIIRWEFFLKKIGVLKSINLYLERDGLVHSLASGSSGQLSLIASMAFIAASVVEGATILIDEPENSLHPQWQKSYIDLLLSLVRYRRVNLFIATHSPMIVSELGDVSGLSSTAPIVVALDDNFLRSEYAPENLEGVMMEVFGTLTPKSHHLSKFLVSLLNDVGAGEASVNQVREKIEKLRKLGADAKQENAFRAVEDMAEQIAAEVDGEEG